MQINLSPWQTDVWDDAHRYKVINVGRRAGKSTLSVLKIINFAFKNKNTISWMIAPTYKQAKAIAFSLFKEYLPKEAVVKTNETELVFTLKNSSTIHLKGADTADSLRGVRVDFCVFDETAFIDHWEEVWKVVRPTLADSKAECWFISTPNGFNHFKDLAERGSQDFKYFHFTTYDNPYIPKEEIEAMRSEMSDDSFAQEIMGEFRKMSGLIYKEFNRDVHMVTIPDLTGYTVFRSLDFGFGHNAALGYFAVSPDQTSIYCYDGLYKNQLVTDQLAENIKLKDGTKYITGAWADSAQPQIIADLETKGVHFDPVEKGADSVIKGIVNVAGLLKIRKDTGKPTLMFSKEIPWIADEFEKYRWVTSKNENSAQKEMPLKREDDAVDMIRYFAMSYKKEEEVVDLPEEHLFDEQGNY